MPCSLSGHGWPCPGPPHDAASAPLVSNSSTGGAGLQQRERGGVSVAPRSSSVSDFGRCTTHTRSPLVATPAACPISQPLGSGLGQNGSTSNTGASATAAEAPLAIGVAPPASSFANTASPITAVAAIAPRLSIERLP